MANAKWRPEVLDQALEMIKDFRPSTSREDGDLIETDFNKWDKAIRPNQYKDYGKIRHILRNLRLGEKELGYIWYWCDRYYNWRGWATEWGLIFKMAGNKNS